MRLEDGRLIEDAWSGLAQQRRRRHPGIPKIVHAVAGSAYSVQGRTAPATVHYIASAVDARETYVALTRHRHDVRIVVESDRLDAACRARQEDPRMAPTRSAMLEILFKEARRYSEKANVVDHVYDRTKFIESGSVDLAQSLDRHAMGAAVETARRVELASQYLGERCWGISAQFRQLASRFLSHRRMPPDAKTIIERVSAWIHLRSSAACHARQRPVYEVQR
jgi:hypothetical protein